MAESKKGSDKKKSEKKSDAVSKALQEQLKVLEDHLEAIEQAKKQRNLVSIVGLLLIILAIALFVMNLSNFVKEKSQDQAFQKELLTKIGEDLKEVKKNPNLQAMMNDVRSEILPLLAKEIVARFKKDAPKFQAKGEDFAKEMQDYLENDVKSKLIKSLSTSLVDVEAIIKEKYPNVSADDLKKVLDIAQAEFIIQITNIIEERINSVRLDIEDLKASVAKFKECEEYKQLDPNHPDTLNHVKLQMVESMLELVIYQINTQKGEVIVTDTVVGGAK